MKRWPKLSVNDLLSVIATTTVLNKAIAHPAGLPS